MLIDEVGYKLNPMSSSHTCRCNTVDLFCLLETSSITLFYHFVIFQNHLPSRGIEHSLKLRCHLDPQQRLSVVVAAAALFQHLGPYLANSAILCAHGNVGL